MSTEDLSMVSQILAGVTNPDKTIRTNANNKLQQLRKNLGALSFCLLQISSLPQEEALIKTTALVILRKVLDLGTIDEWKQIPSDLKEQIKVKSIEVFMNETNASQRNKISDVIVEIVDKVNDADEQWDDLKNITKKIFDLSIKDQNNSPSIESILKLTKDAVGFLFDDLYQLKEKFSSFFLEIFNSNSPKLKMTACELLCEFISFGKKEEIAIFQPFIFNILQTILESLNIGEEECLKSEMETIIEISSIETDMITPHFNDLFILSQKIIDKKDFDDEKIRELAIEMLVNFIEEKPSVIETHKDKMKTLFEILYKYALEIERNVEMTWSTPNCSNYEDLSPIEEENVKCAQGMIDRLVETFDIENSSPILFELINSLVSQNDWAYKYIGLLSLGNLTENEGDMAATEVALPVVFAMASNENQKVRFAAIHCINQFCNSYNPEFQKKYITQVIPLLLKSFQTEQVLRVQCEIIETLTSFIQFTTSENVMPYVKELYEVLFGIFMQNIHDMLRKSVTECILEISSTIEEQCTPYAPKAFDVLIKYYSDIYTKRTNKILYGALLGCITTIGPYVKETYYQVIPDILNSMIELVKGITFQNDPIRKDLEISLENIVPILQENFKHLIPNIIQTVITLLKIRPKMSISSSPEEQLNIEDILDDKKSKKIELKTSETEDLEGSLSLLLSIMESLEEEFRPYIDTVEKEVLPLITFQFNPKIRSKVSKLLPPLIEIVPNENKATKGKMYIRILIDVIEKETDFVVAQKMFSHLKDVIDYSGFILTKQELNSLFEKLLTFFNNVEKKRQNILSSKEKAKITKSPDDDEDDNDISELIKEDLSQIEEVQSSISDTIGILFKTHKDICDDIINVITTNVLPKYANSQSSIFESKIALYIADDMIEFLGQEKLSTIWNDLFKLLVSLARHKDHAVRQAACYGIGVFVQFTTMNFDLYAEEVIKALYAAMEVQPKDEEEKRDWGLAHDNIITSIGKIIYYKRGSDVVKKGIEQLIEIWINNLPIKYDVSEQETQHLWLTEMILGKENIIPEKCVGNAFKAVTKVYKSKMGNENINGKIEEIFNEVKNNEGLKKIVDELYQQGDNKIKKKLEKLIK